MQRNESRPQTGHAPADDAHVPFSSNAVRLRPRHWLFVAAVLAVLIYSIPVLWTRIEKLDAGPDYRVPYRLSHDYWHVRRYFSRAAAENKTLVLGDSVVWGHYVGKEETLSHYLNELAGDAGFANLGIDGIHPAAMAGLVEHYGTDIADKRVLLHLNLLWMSSRRHDLTSGKESALNHPKLVSQFYPAVPDYRASLSDRIGIVVGRKVPFFGWVDHVRIAYFEDADLPRWTLEHPYANPASAVTLELPSPGEPPVSEQAARPWTATGIRPFNPPWVELETSLQWRSFRRTVEVLRSRANAVFVLVGPFNEHMLGPESLATYRERVRQAAAWLKEQGIPHAAPPPLPSEYYADASHPLAEGYRLLAEQLMQDEAFLQFQQARADGH